MALKITFVLGFVLCATGMVSPPFALALGLLYGFSFVHPFHQKAARPRSFCCRRPWLGWVSG